MMTRLRLFASRIAACLGLTAISFAQRKPETKSQSPEISGFPGTTGFCASIRSLAPVSSTMTL
jgi:hypothetical protein